MKDQYENELAGTVISIFGSGNSDPSVEEIAESHFPDKHLGNEIVAGIGKRLMKISKIVEREYEIPNCLVNRRYYLRFRADPPTTDAEAAACVPGGVGNQSYGIRKLNGDTDLVWQATIRRDGKSAAGKEKRLADRVLGAYEQDDLSQENVLRLLAEVDSAAAPEKKEVLARLLQATLGEKAEQPELEAGDE